MKYTDNVCQGCGQAFTDSDDVVVCPECGTPQHRECYERNNQCVCADKHAEGYAWQGKVNNERALPEEKKKTIPCPNCGYENPEGTTVCKQCGMKFTLFGMNVVDAMNENEKKTVNPNRDIPDYAPPFTLGVGEGFEQEEKPEGEADSADEAVQTENPQQPITADEVSERITRALSGGEAEVLLSFEGPFPGYDRIDGVSTNTVGTFIGSNAMRYISKFKRMQNGKKLSFNFAAFFFGPFWFFYRKLYKAGVIVMTTTISLSILATPYINKVAELYAELLPAYEAGTITEEQILAVAERVSAVGAPAMLLSFLSFIIQLLCGFLADRFYKKYVIKHAGIAEKLPQKKIAMAYIVKNGGASILIAAAAYFAGQLLSILVSGLL